MATTNGWNNSILTAKSSINLDSGVNAIAIGNDAFANTIDIGTGAAAKTVTVGSTNGASASTLQSGTGALNVTATNGALTINSGTGNLGISTDASATTVNIATGAAAKVATLGSTNGASSLALKYGTADFSLASATGNVIVAQDTGEVTKPLQPAFAAYCTGNPTNITGDGTPYTIVWDGELYDQNADYDTGTGIFTAPVTGKYFFSTFFQIVGLTSSHTGGYIWLATTARTYYLFYANYWAMSSGTGLTLNFSINVPMTAGDTAYVVVRVDSGTKVVDINGTSSYTGFSGYLVC